MGTEGLVSPSPELGVLVMEWFSFGVLTLVPGCWLLACGIGLCRIGVSGGSPKGKAASRQACWRIWGEGMETEQYRNNTSHGP